MLSQDYIVQLIQNYGLILLFGLAIFEGPIVAAIAGYFIKIGNFHWASVIFILVIADLIGDSVLYWIGSHGRNKSLTKWRRKAGLSDARLEELQEQFESRGSTILLFGKIAHAPGMAVLLAAGISHMNYLKFLFYNLLGSIPKTIVFVAIGYALGAAFGRFNNYLLEYTIAMGVLLAVVGYIFWRRYRMKSKEKTKARDE